MIVLGLDPGVKTGYALLRETERGRLPEILQHGTVSTEAGDELAPRLKLILDTIDPLVRQADVAVIEVPANITYARSSHAFGKALNLASMNLNNRITGAIMGQLSLHGVKVVERVSTWNHQNKAGKGAQVLALYRDLGRTSEHARDAILLALTYTK